jgi:coproporphyrinogen III oxidase-like Fe-S oxidoreductase
LGKIEKLLLKNIPSRMEAIQNNIKRRRDYWGGGGRSMVTSRSLQAMLEVLSQNTTIMRKS